MLKLDHITASRSTFTSHKSSRDWKNSVLLISWYVYVSSVGMEDFFYHYVQQHTI